MGMDAIPYSAKTRRHIPLEGRIDPDLFELSFGSFRGCEVEITVRTISVSAERLGLEQRADDIAHSRDYMSSIPPCSRPSGHQFVPVKMTTGFVKCEFCAVTLDAEENVIAPHPV